MVKDKRTGLEHDPALSPKEVTEITHDMLAKSVLAHHKFKRYGVKYFIYKGGVSPNKDPGISVGFRGGKKSGYVEIAKDSLSSDLQRLYDEWEDKYKTGKPCDTALIGRTIGTLERLGLITEEEIDHDLVNVNNGLLNIKDGELVENDKEQFIPISIPVTFDKNIKTPPPRIDKFFRDITTDAKGKIPVDENDVATLYEMPAYLLEPDYPIHKAVMLTGDGHNGKTTVLKVNTAFVGRKNVGRISIYDFNDRFATIELMHKLGNFRGDLGHDVLGGHARGIIKDLTGGEDELMARRIRQDWKYFANRAKFYYACNRLPSIDLRDKAFIERWVVEVLPNSYPDNQDFEQSLLTPNELSGLLNMALEAKARLKKQKKFSKSKSQGYKELYKLWAEAKLKSTKVPNHLVVGAKATASKGLATTGLSMADELAAFNKQLEANKNKDKK